MKAKTIYISIRIVFMFSIAILSTFLPEMFRDFFGDWKCNGATYVNDTYRLQGCRYNNFIHEQTFHWGYRHWLYLFMCLSLFIVQVVELFTFIGGEKND